MNLVQVSRGNIILKQFNPASAKDPTHVEVIDPGEYATVLFTPSALGIMNCGKMWPVEMAPLSLEITFASPSESVISNATQLITFTLGAVSIAFVLCHQQQVHRQGMDVAMATPNHKNSVSGNGASEQRVSENGVSEVKSW